MADDMKLKPAQRVKFINAVKEIPGAIVNLNRHVVVISPVEREAVDEVVEENQKTDKAMANNKTTEKGALSRNPLFLCDQLTSKQKQKNKQNSTQTMKSAFRK